MTLGALIRQRASLFLARQTLTSTRAASGHGHDEHHPAQPGDGSARGVHLKGYHDPSELTNTPVPLDYIPGTDSYAFKNPHPKLNKGRLDWLFEDSWRRPASKEEGQEYRAEWIPFGFNVYDEHEDWRIWHTTLFGLCTVFFAANIAVHWLMPTDWPTMVEWSRREAYFEIERRRKAGLPLISKDYVDPKNISLPAEEELTNFDIVI